MDLKVGFHIGDTLGCLKPSKSAACRVFSASAGGTTVNIESIEHLLLQRQLRWLGHVILMPSNRLHRRLLYELLIGQRPAHRPKLRFYDHNKSVLRKCDIPEADLEQLAADRDSWRSICATGLVWRVLQQPPIKRQAIVVLADMPLPKQFELNLLVLNVVASALQISVSAVVYASIKDRSDNTTTVHVIVDIDGLPQASKQ